LIEMSSSCATCGIKAALRCVGCLEAPEYESGDATMTSYCSSTCQTLDWPNHKAHCRALGRRIKLHRAARLSRAVLLAYRQVLYDIDLEKIELRNGALYLHQRQRSVSAPAKIVRFPEHLTSNVEHREAALLNNQCTLAMALLGRLIRKLLKGRTGLETRLRINLYVNSTIGVASRIEVLDVHIEKPRRPTKLVPGPDASAVPHTILKVRLRLTGEIWVVDTAGSQYGFREVLVPFDKYMAEKSCRIASAPTTYDATETKDLDYYATLDFMNRTKAQRDRMRAERKARMSFAGFVDQDVGEDVLAGSAAKWDGKLDALVAALKARLLEHVAKASEDWE
jgi:hypothetical protein